MPSGDGHFFLYLHDAVRKASRTKVGDKVTVTIKFDNDYKSGPQHPVQEWFGSALDKNSNAKRNWEVLSPSRKKEILRYFANLKSGEAKARILTRALNVLSGKKEQFMRRS
jgi:hypothetical protein